MRTELVEDALKAADALRGGLSGAVFHADHGSQYTSKDFATLCTDLGVTQSMGGIGSSADNALAESFNAALKREVLQDNSCWPDAATCRREVFRLAGPLQHHTTTLPLPLLEPRRLRKDPHTRYAARSCLTTNPVSTTWGQGPHGRVSWSVHSGLGPQTGVTRYSSLLGCSPISPLTQPLIGQSIRSSRRSRGRLKLWPPDSLGPENLNWWPIGSKRGDSDRDSAISPSPGRKFS